MTVSISGVAQPVGPAANRHEIDSASHWDDESGTDYFFEPDAAEVAAGNKETLSDFGWTTTGLVYVPGSGADFMTVADKGIPGHFVLSPASDVLQSPALFGAYSHSHGAAHHLGHEPITLTMEMWAQFAVASSDEVASCLGFVAAGGSIITAGDAVAVIRSDSSVFACRSNVDADGGAAVDNDWHLWKLVLSLGTTGAIQWFRDNVSQGVLDLREDVMPLSFGVGNVAAGNNRLNIGPGRIYYR